MNPLKVVLFIMINCMVTSFASADIYEWTDENGVKHYSNYAPPAESKILMKTDEEPYDEAADRARMEADRQELLELDRLELVQREAEIELREAEAERRLAEADRMMEEALREAEFYREEVRTRSRIIYRGGGYWCRDDYFGCNYSIYDRWYYRKKHNRNYHNKLYHRSSYPRHRYTKKHHRPHKYNSTRHKYRAKSQYRQRAKYSNRQLNSRGAAKYRGNSIGSRRSGIHGRGIGSRGRSGFGRRY